MKSSAQAMRAASRTAASLASGTAYRMFSRTVAPKSTFSCSAMAIRPRRLATRKRRRSTPSATIGIEEAKQKCHEGAFARARRAHDDGDRSYGRLQIHVLEGAALGLVTEA